MKKTMLADRADENRPDASGSSVFYPPWWVAALREIRAEIKAQDALLEKNGDVGFRCPQSYRDGMDRVLGIIEQYQINMP